MLVLQSMIGPPSPQNIQFGVLILAGGNSARMGSPKPWLAFDHKTSFLQRSIHIYRAIGIEEIVVVINSDICKEQWTTQLDSISKDCILIRNQYSERGRLYSIHLGLERITSANVFVHNVDSPYVSVDTLRSLKGSYLAQGVTVPSYNGRSGHPIIVTEKVKDRIIRDHHTFETLKHALSQFDVRRVEVDDKHILTTVNTAAEYTRLKNEYLR